MLGKLICLILVICLLSCTSRKLSNRCLSSERKLEVSCGSYLTPYESRVKELSSGLSKKYLDVNDRLQMHFQNLQRLYKNKKTIKPDKVISFNSSNARGAKTKTFFHVQALPLIREMVELQGFRHDAFELVFNLAGKNRSNRYRSAGRGFSAMFISDKLFDISHYGDTLVLVDVYVGDERSVPNYPNVKPGVFKAEQLATDSYFSIKDIRTIRQVRFPSMEDLLLHQGEFVIKKKINGREEAKGEYWMSDHEFWHTVHPAAIHIGQYLNSPLIQATDLVQGYESRQLTRDFIETILFGKIDLYEGDNILFKSALNKVKVLKKHIPFKVKNRRSVNELIRFRQFYDNLK